MQLEIREILKNQGEILKVLSSMKDTEKDEKETKAPRKLLSLNF